MTIVNGRQNAYQLSERDLKQLDAGQMLQGIRRNANGKSIGVPVTLGVTGFDQNGNPEFAAAEGYFTDTASLKRELQSRQKSRKYSLDTVLSDFYMYRNHYDAMEGDAFFARRTNDAKARGDFSGDPVDVVSAGSYLGKTGPHSEKQASGPKAADHGRPFRKNTEKPAPGPVDSKENGTFVNKKRKGFQKPEEATDEKLRKTVDDTIKQYETKDAAKDMQQGRDKPGSGGKSPVNIDMRQELQRMMVRQMMMEMCRNLTSGDLVHTAGYVGGAFLMLRHCGGIKENLTQAFHLQAGAFENGPLKPFADVCKKVGPKGRIPYDPLCAATDSVGLDMAMHTAMHDPKRTPKSLHDAKATYDRRQKYIFETMKKDGTDPKLFVRERQKVICQSILEDPDRASFYGIEVGDDNWNEIVKQCHAKVRFEGSGSGRLQDIRTVVESYEMPPGGVCKADGSPWFDGRGGRELKIRMPVTTRDGFEVREMAHQEELMKWCDKREVDAIGRALNTKPPMKAVPQDLACAARLKSRFAMMGDQGFTTLDMENMWETHVRVVTKEPSFSKGHEEAFREDKMPEAAKQSNPFWDENAFDGINPAENRKKQDDAFEKRGQKAKMEMEMDFGEDDGYGRTDRKLQDAMEQITRKEESEKGSFYNGPELR